MSWKRTGQWRLWKNPGSGEVERLAVVRDSENPRDWRVEMPRYMVEPLLSLPLDRPQPELLVRGRPTVEWPLKDSAPFGNDYVTIDQNYVRFNLSEWDRTVRIDGTEGD